MLLERGDEPVGVGVDAQVDDLEAGSFEHHADEVLADVVDVALDGPEDHLADRLDPGLGQERPEDGHAALHRVRGEQDLGHEQDAVTEVDPDDPHPLDERRVEDPLGAPPPAEEDVRPGDDLVGQPVVHVVVHLLDELLVGQAGEVELLLVRHGRVLLRPGAIPTVGAIRRPVGHPSARRRRSVRGCCRFHDTEWCRIMERSTAAA